jgi:hypothetical protein
MNKEKVVFLSILLIASGFLTLGPSINTQAQIYNLDFGNDHYKASRSKKNSDVMQKLKCVNSNINVNGIDITKIPQDETATAAANEGGEGTNAANTENGKGLADRINFDRNLVNICKC